MPNLRDSKKFESFKLQQGNLKVDWLSGFLILGQHPVQKILRQANQSLIGRLVKSVSLPWQVLFQVRHIVGNQPCFKDFTLRYRHYRISISMEKNRWDTSFFHKHQGTGIGIRQRDAFGRSAKQVFEQKFVQRTVPMKTPQFRRRKKGHSGFDKSVIVVL